MIKCEVILPFTLGKFDELKNVIKVMERNQNEFGVGDTFECNKEMADYLMGNNATKDIVVKIIEVIPEEEPKKEVKPKTIKKASKK